MTDPVATDTQADPVPTPEQRYFDALKRIGSYMTPQQIERDTKNVGLSYTEYLEMAYENVLSEAKAATKGKRRPK